MSTNRRNFDEIKHMSLLIKDDEIYDEIREKKLEIESKNNLIVKVYIMKNISELK